MYWKELSLGGGGSKGVKLGRYIGTLRVEGKIIINSKDKMLYKQGNVILVYVNSNYTDTVSEQWILV